MSSTAADVQYGIDENQNRDIRSEESVEAVMKNDKFSNPLQSRNDGPITRKGSFMITDILKKDEDLDDSDNAVLDDQPDTSEAAESPKMAQVLDDSLPWASPAVMSPSDSYSRFRIVKIESRDRWHRGRWTCHDFADPPERVKVEQTVDSESNADNATRNGPSIYYIPGVQDALMSPFGIVYSTGGHPILEANLLPSSPRYTRGSHFFSSNLSAVDDTTEDIPQSEMTGVQFSSERISTVDQPNVVAVGHSAARRLFASGENNTLTPLKISVSAPLQNNSQDDERNKLLVARQLSNSMSLMADVVQKSVDQTSPQTPLDVMMSATLGPSSSEPDMR